MSSTKERIDILLVEQGFFESREKAKASLMAGLVFADEERIEKPGTKLSREAKITVKGAIHPYVSRGGLKLEKALRFFAISVQDVLMLDIGASTGGFTDCALQNGAARVIAIDVGYNQLDWSLRSDSRVYVMERTNFRYLQPSDLPQGNQANFATIDVSFISLKLMLPPLKLLLASGSKIIALIKPQFEAGRDKVGKSGVVRDSAVHREVLNTVLEFAAKQGFQLKGLTFSPITGGEGNIEFLAYWTLDKSVDELKDEETSLASTLEPHWHKKMDETVLEATTTFKVTSKF
jgi:23S rRNA (cytidine1920-2'-O)/16S rRNA (cytidine1409-2'-O)-methyltransferase